MKIAFYYYFVGVYNNLTLTHMYFLTVERVKEPLILSDYQTVEYRLPLLCTLNLKLSTKGLIIFKKDKMMQTLFPGYTEI